MSSSQSKINEKSLRRKVALVIGISQYAEGRQLKNAEKDAKDMHAVLSKIGFIVMKSLSPTRSELNHIILDFIESIHEDDLALFYFAGHATQYEEHNYLIPKDNIGINTDNLRGRSVDVQRVLDDLGDKKPFVRIFLLDCCRLYPLSNVKDNSRNTQINNTKSIGLTAMTSNGSLIAFACAPGTVADDGENAENGLFTKHLLQHITGENVDILDLIRDVTAAVITESKRKQHPFFTGSLPQRNIFLFEKSLNQNDVVAPIMNTPRKDYSVVESVFASAMMAENKYLTCSKLHKGVVESRYECLTKPPTDPRCIIPIDGSSESPIAGSRNYLVLQTRDKISTFDRNRQQRIYEKWNGGVIADICYCSPNLGFIILTENAMFRFSAFNQTCERLGNINQWNNRAFSTCTSNEKNLLISYKIPGSPIDLIDTNSWKRIKQWTVPNTCKPDEYINRLRYSSDFTLIGVSIYSNPHLHFEIRDENLSILHKVPIADVGCCGLTALPKLTWLLSDGHWLYHIDEQGHLTVIERKRMNPGTFFDSGNVSLFADNTIVVRSPKALYFY